MYMYDIFHIDRTIREYTELFAYNIVYYIFSDERFLNMNLYL